MTIQFPVAFEKMSGTGNDFIIIDNRLNSIPHSEQAGFARQVCRRMFSVGADGVIFIEESESVDFRWQFYNADGSVAEMCGNGARCAARFAHLKGIGGDSLQFETIAGVVEAQLGDEHDGVRVRMPEPENFRLNLQMHLDGELRSCHFVNTGVPHAVFFVENDDIPVKKWGRKVRFHELFEPAGTNANFVKVIDAKTIHVRTYERGVEDETRACGTGAVASALIAARFKGVESPVEVYTSGGDRLIIYFTMSEGGELQRVYMQGPTRRIYTGSLTAEALL